VKVFVALAALAVLRIFDELSKAQSRRRQPPPAPPPVEARAPAPPDATLARLATALRLRADRRGWFRSRLAGHRVTLRRDDEDGLVRLEVGFRGGFPRQVRAFRRVGKRRPTGTDAATGDAAFDAAVQVSGPAVAVAAAFGPTERVMLRGVVEHDASALARPAYLENGQLVAVLRDSASTQSVRSLLHRLVGAARACHVKASSVPQRLMRAIERETDVAVLERGLDALAAGPPELRRRLPGLVQKLAADLDPMRAVLGASRQGARAQPRLLRWAQDASKPTAVRLRAAEGLQRPPAALLLALLPLAEGEQQLRLARSLGAHGDARSVAALLATCRAPGTSAGLRAAARAALDGIQARLGDVDHGRLSLASADAAAGALSVAEGRQGAGPGALSPARQAGGVGQVRAGGRPAPRP
jgi:hypothetical protein